MMDWILFIIGIVCFPITAILEGNIEFFYYYCPIQATALLIAYFLRNKGILTYGSPLVHYIVGFIIGHVVYVGISVWAIAHRGFMP